MRTLCIDHRKRAAEERDRKRQIQKAKRTYLSGMRVKLLEMDDVQAPPAGTKGTVRMVDDIGSVCISWDNGSSLNAVLGVDKIEIIQDEEGE